MLLVNTRTKWFAENKPAKFGSAPFSIPPRTKSHSTLFVFAIFIVLTGCDAKTNQGQFELDLFSSIFFGDISVTQGESTSATVLINRHVNKSRFSQNINMSLIDPPGWLSYKIKENPVKGTTSAIKFDIGQDAKPGIYRLVLYGVGNANNSVIEDSITFHLIVEKAKHDKDATNASFIIRKKLFSLLKLG